jgi:hypothetical protein
VLRRYLEEGHGIAALERTTAELIRALPSTPADARLNDRCGALLGEADLVKFARARRDTQAAERFARDARALLDGWHATVLKADLLAALVPPSGPAPQAE